MVRGLGERLQKQRQKLKLSQKEVATVMGISPSILSNYENGERTPSIENLMALANLYHCSTDYLLGLEKNTTSNIDASMLNAEQIYFLQRFLSALTEDEKDI